MTPGKIFDSGRLARLLVLELANYWKRILLATGMIFAFCLFLYINIYDDAGNSFSEGVFIVLSAAAGALFTSIIFSDMHDPLAHYQYMTLPCSQLERFASKYLLTGPLYLIYALFIMALFENLAPGIVNAFSADSGRQAPIFVAFTEIPKRFLVMLFFMGHVLFLTGAIVFRSFAVVKTGFCLFVLPYTFIFVSFLSLKIIYFDHYDHLLDFQPSADILPGAGMLLLRNDGFLYMGWILIYLWLVYMAYSCLKDHEA